MPLTTATATAAIAHTRGLGALRPAASDAGAMPHALEHATELARRLGEPVLGGNRALLLPDGRDALDAMFKAIDGAREHINIESSIAGADLPGCVLIDKLSERCRAGVRVNWLVDGAGSAGMSTSFSQRLLNAGMRLCEASPVPRWRRPLSRTLHVQRQRRLLVVDGRIGFIGGTDISGLHGSAAQAGNAAAATWRDLQVQLEGPAVRRLQQLFIAHWLRNTGCAMQQARYFPPLAPVSAHRVGVVAGDVGRHRDPQESALLGAVATARSHVLLSTAGITWRPALVRTLVQAAQRGVRVELLLHSGGGFWAALVAGRWLHTRLLQAGVLLHLAHDTVLHAEACAVDGVWASVGASRHGGLPSAPASVVVVDEGFAAQLECAFRDGALRARPGAQRTPTVWEPRALWHRCKDTLARRFAQPS